MYHWPKNILLDHTINIHESYDKTSLVTNTAQEKNVVIKRRHKNCLHEYNSFLKLLPVIFFRQCQDERIEHVTTLRHLAIPVFPNLSVYKMRQNIQKFLEWQLHSPQSTHNLLVCRKWTVGLRPLSSHIQIKW